jgi:hypothetical protein
MKVSALIAELQKCNPDAEVIAAPIYENENELYMDSIERIQVNKAKLLPITYNDSRYKVFEVLSGECISEQTFNVYKGEHSEPSELVVKTIDVVELW